MVYFEVQTISRDADIESIEDRLFAADWLRGGGKTDGCPWVESGANKSQDQRHFKRRAKVVALPARLKTAQPPISTPPAVRVAPPAPAPVVTRLCPKELKVAEAAKAVLHHRMSADVIDEWMEFVWVARSVRDDLPVSFLRVHWNLAAEHVGKWVRGSSLVMTNSGLWQLRIP